MRTSNFRSTDRPAAQCIPRRSQGECVPRGGELEIVLGGGVNLGEAVCKVHMRGRELIFVGEGSGG